MSRIWELERKLRAGEPLTESDLEQARNYLDSEEIVERTIAYDIVMRDADLAERQHILQLLEEECRKALDSKASYPCNLVLVLRRIPMPTLAASVVFRQFVTVAASAGSTGCRMNAIYVLEKLADSGDVAAMESLTSAMSDRDVLVRQNAGNAVARIRRHDNSQ